MRNNRQPSRNCAFRNTLCFRSASKRETFHHRLRHRICIHLDLFYTLCSQRSNHAVDGTTPDNIVPQHLFRFAARPDNDSQHFSGRFLELFADGFHHHPCGIFFHFPEHRSAKKISEHSFSTNFCNSNYRIHHHSRHPLSRFRERSQEHQALPHPLANYPATLFNAVRRILLHTSAQSQAGTFWTGNRTAWRCSTITISFLPSSRKRRFSDARI